MSAATLPQYSPAATHKMSGPVWPAQLNLPTGPTHALKGRERTDEDRQWYSDQLRASQHSRLVDKMVFERLVYFASLNSKRVAFPSVARVAREIPSLSGKGSEHCSPRTVQRALRRLELAGLIQCLTRAGGHVTGRYHVPGRVVLGVTESHPKEVREVSQDLPIRVVPFGKTLTPNLKGGKEPSEEQPTRPKGVVAPLLAEREIYLWWWPR